MTGVRHLILEASDRFEQVTLACTSEPQPYRREAHAVLAAAVTCPACRAVQAARVIVIDADQPKGNEPGA